MYVCALENSNMRRQGPSRAAEPQKTTLPIWAVVVTGTATDREFTAGNRGQRFLLKTDSRT